MSTMYLFDSTAKRFTITTKATPAMTEFLLANKIIIERSIPKES